MKAMLMCRLFHADRPFEQLDSRLLPEGTITIGRDPSADWVLVDQEGLLSRIHCSLDYDGHRLLLTDRSTNGVVLHTGERAPKGEAVEVRLHEAIRFGSFFLLAALIAEEVVDPPAKKSPAHQGDVGSHLSDGPDASCDRPTPHRDGSLLEAFCEGAGLEVSAFSGEDPVELMNRLGHMYRHTVAGLAVLMSERAKAKLNSDLERTTIVAADNNPFKWSTTRHLAQDLLLGGGRGFLADAGAVEASFRDIADHLAAMSNAARIAADMTLEALAPEAIEAEAQTQSSLLRSRASACWAIYARRHAQLSAEGGASHAFGQALGRAYSEASPR